MLIDSRTLNDAADIETDVAIIGAGAAGITLAVELAKDFKNLVLIESGGLEPDPHTQRLYEGPVLGHGTTDLSSSRLRYFGGTTNHWNGQCAPLDPWDFEAVPGRPYSGWPFRHDEMTAFYERDWYCELGHFSAELPDLATAFTSRPFIESSQFALTEFRVSPPTRFGKRFRRDLESSERVRVCLYGNVVDFAFAPGGQSISAVLVRTLAGQHYRVKAKAIVLCCGGIENARILLNATSQSGAGIGNEHDLVGRFFMDHLVVKMNIAPSYEIYDFEMIGKDGDIRVERALKNSRETMRHPGRAGCSVLPFPYYEFHEFHEASSFFAFKEILVNAAHGRLPPMPVEKGCDALSDMTGIITTAYFRKRGGGRSLKFIDVLMLGEQAPNPDSRVVLTDERDALGMRRVGLDWRISQADRDNLFQTSMEVGRAIGAAGFGRLSTPLQAGTDQSMISTAWHHMGTTRMHDDKRYGVIDRNCRLHQVENLYVAGSSVFPTGGRVNPTLTIVALAIRLADHLKREVKSS